jgi:hypothetical protein
LASSTVAKLGAVRVNVLREMSNRERWIVNAMQAQNNLNRGSDARN